jgi:hypothetical protein
MHADDERMTGKKERRDNRRYRVRISQGQHSDKDDKQEYHPHPVPVPRFLVCVVCGGGHGMSAQDTQTLKRLLWEEINGRPIIPTSFSHKPHSFSSPTINVPAFARSRWTSFLSGAAFVTF